MEKTSIEHHCDLLIIGGSAGSLEVVLPLLENIRKPLTFPIIIVLHRKNTSENALEELIKSKSSLPVKEVDDKDTIENGTIYLAPPDYHLLIEKDKTLSLDVSEKVLYSRPNIDVTFESAADIYSNHLVCILLSGANSDGAKGLKTVCDNGGLAVVQDPATAIVGFMPQQAIDLNGDKLGAILPPEGLISLVDHLNEYKQAQQP